MTEHEQSAARPSAESARTLLREIHTRRLDREGIPMVLALVDERGSLSIAADADTRVEGPVYADLLAGYTELLTPEPTFAPDDEGGLITAMQVLAYQHFGPGGTELAVAQSAQPSDTEVTPDDSLPQGVLP